MAISDDSLLQMADESAQVDEARMVLTVMRIQRVLPTDNKLICEKTLARKDEH